MRCKLSEKAIKKHRKGLWSPDEDKKLTYYVINHGHGCWSSVPVNAGLERSGKSCRLRWINYLRPGLKRGPFSSQEDETILTLHGLLGNKWSQMARHLPGRTDNEIKNYWHSHLKKRVAKSAHLQLHTKFDHTNSNMASIKPYASCLNTSNFTDSSFADMVQSVPPASHVSKLPELLFAEWITLDEFQQDFGMSSDQPLSHGSNSQLSTIEFKRQYNKGSSHSSGTSTCLDNASSYESMVHTQMAMDQVFEYNDGEFDIENFMYM